MLIIEGPLKVLVTPDSLVDTGRTARKPMLAWLEELIGKVDRLEREDGPRATAEFSAVQNNFSLITMLNEGTAAARRECNAQIRHAVENNAAGEAVQPWVNLARLDRIEGDVAASARKLSVMLRMAKYGTVKIGGISAGSGEGDKRFAAAVYASERFHLALSGGYDLRRHLAQAERLFGRKEHPLLAEQQVIAGTLTRDAGIAREGLSNRAWFVDAMTRLTGMFYRAAWAFHDGHPEAVDRLSLELLRQTAPKVPGSIPDHALMRLVFRAGLLTMMRGDEERGISLLERAKSFAIQLGDAEYTARTGAELERLGILEGWKEQAAASGYRSFRGLPPFFDGRNHDDIVARSNELRRRIHQLRQPGSSMPRAVA